MENTDDIEPLLRQFEEAEYYGDFNLVRYLSNKIYRLLTEKATRVSKDNAKVMDAAAAMLSASEIIQDHDFFSAVQAIEHAIEYYNEAAIIAKNELDHSLESEIFRTIGDIYREKLDDRLSANRYYKRVLRVLEREISQKEGEGGPGLYNHYYNLAELYSEIGDWKSAELNLGRVLEYAIKERKYFMIATAYRHLLQAYLQTRDEVKLLETFIEAREFFQEVLRGITSDSKQRNYTEIAEVYHVFASFYDILEDLRSFNEISAKEAQCYMDAARECEDASDPIGSAIYYHSAGLVYKKIRKFHEAVNSFLISASKYESMDLLDSAAENYILAAECLEFIKKSDEALHLISKAAKLYDQLGMHESSTGLFYKAMDIVDYAGGSPSLKRDFMMEIVDQLSKLAGISSERDSAHHFVEIASLLFSLDEFQQCIQYLKEARDLFKKIYDVDNVTVVATCNDLLAILLISMILDDVGEVRHYLDLLDDLGNKSPAGREYASIARKIHLIYTGVLEMDETITASRKLFANPTLRSIFMILADKLENKWV